MPNTRSGSEANSRSDRDQEIGCESYENAGFPIRQLIVDPNHLWSRDLQGWLHAGRFHEDRGENYFSCE